MKILISLVMLICATESFAEYSEGFRMGSIDKISKKGRIIKSVEGQMLMGREGTPFIKGEGEDKKVINPWYFSAEDEMFQKLNDASGPVWVSYKQAYINLGVKYDTDYLITKVEEVTMKSPTNCNITVDGAGIKSKGKRSGRIVKASKKGKVVKTYEVIIQVGNSGNQFKHMSITDEKLYACAVSALKSAKKVDVHYTESHINTSLRDTSYTITKIKVQREI